MSVTKSVRTTYKGKRTTFSTRRLKDGSTAYYVAGKRATKHQTRLARSLLKQQAAGLRPSIKAARGHADEYSSKKQVRQAFYDKYDPLDVFWDLPTIHKNPLLSLGTLKVKGKTIKRSWGYPWKKSKIRVKYDWYAIITAYPPVDDKGRPRSPDEFEFDFDGDEDFERLDAAERQFQELVIPLYPDGVDIGPDGFLMDDIIDGFEQNVATVVKSLELLPADRETQDEVDPLDVDRYLVALFRHRYVPSERRRR